MEPLENLTGATLFETKRMRCRRWLPADLAAIFEVYSDPEGALWVGDGQPISREQCKQWLQVTDKNYATRGYGMFALDSLRSGEILGFGGLVHPGGQVDAEIKYAIRRAYWGQGLASEVVPAMVAYGARAHELTKIIATIAPENLASQRVVLKSDFALVETLDSEDGPTRYYAWHADDPA